MRGGAVSSDAAAAPEFFGGAAVVSDLARHARYNEGMSTNPPSFSSPTGAAGVPLAAAGRPVFGQASASAMSMKWSALHDAIGIVAMLAGLASEPMRAEVRNFPAVIRDAGGWRLAMAEQGIDDLSAIMEPGLAALLAVHGRGADAAPAALALWQEFHAARSAILLLVPPPTGMGPRRNA